MCWTELLLAWLTAAWQQRKMRGRSRLATGGNRWDDDDDLEGGGPSRSKAAATGSKARYRRGESSDEDEDGDGCCHSLKTFLRTKISWAVVALLLVVWYSEHVALRSKILYVQLELATLQADYTKASITADSTATALRALTQKNVEEHAGAPTSTGPPATEGLPAAPGAGEEGRHEYDHETTHQVFDAHQEAHAESPPVCIATTRSMHL